MVLLVSVSVTVEVSPTTIVEGLNDLLIVVVAITVRLTVLLAVPTTAALSVFYEDLREAYLRSEFYRGGAVPPTP